jgi:hypothetical protein
MFCRDCGAANQNGRFCSECGHPTGIAPPVPARNDVNVTVNVGPPIVQQQPSPPSLSAVVARGVVHTFRAAQQARREEQERQAALQRLHTSCLNALDRCHDMIAEIEGGIGMDLLPVASPTKSLYARALERRSAAARILAETMTEEQLRRAHELVVLALHDFRETRDALHLSLPPHKT